MKKSKGFAIANPHGEEESGAIVQMRARRRRQIAQ